MGVAGDFLRRVLDEYEELRDENRQLRTESCPDNDLTRRIRRSLEEVDNLPAAIRWFNNLDKDCSPIERGYYLYSLLNRLDDLFSETALIRAETSQGEYIVLGRRWWNVYAKCISQHGDGLLAGPLFSAYSGFSHLRKVQCSDEEWFDGRQLNESFESAISEGFLRVGLCSLSGKSQTQFAGTSVLDSERGVYGFYATCIEYRCNDSEAQDPDYLQELRECVKWAREKKIHVLCFPELSVCLDGRQAIRSEIEEDPGCLCLVIPGSYHDLVEDRTDLWVNVAPIWIVNADEVIELAGFEKTEPFSMPISKARGFSCISDAAQKAEDSSCGHLQEHIRPGNMIRVLNTPLGTFGIMICKDQLARPDLMERYSMLVDHLLVISMNFSPSAWFWDESKKAARINLVATFYVNAAQSVDSENSDVEMAFWQIPCNLPENERNDRREKYYRTLTSSRPNGHIKHNQLPEDGKVYFEIKIPPEMLYS